MLQAEALQDEAAQRRTLSLIIGRLEDFARRVHDRVSEVDWHQRRELIRLLVSLLLNHRPEQISATYGARKLSAGTICCKTSLRPVIEQQALVKRVEIDHEDINVVLRIDPSPFST